MKQLITILFIVLSVKAFSYERPTDTTLHIGLQAGICNSKLRNFDPYYADFNARWGYSVNLFTEYQPSREYAFRGGLCFTNKGFTSKRTFQNSLNEQFDTTMFVSLNYFSIPISATYNFGKRFNPYIGVGVNFGILLNARYYAKLPEFYKNSQVEPFDIKANEKYKNFEFSVHALAGIEYKLKPNTAIFAEAKLDYGLSKIFEGTNIIVGNKIKNNCLHINLGLKIGIPIKLIVPEPSY